MTASIATLPDDGLPPSAPLAASPVWPFPRWIAHRGAGTIAPENTLAAFRVGASHGFRAFECDVKLSADGIPYLMHDDTLLRTAGQDSGASTLVWSEISLLDAGGWHSRGHAGEPPASLEAVTAFCQRNGGVLNIELKPTPGDETRTGEVVAAETEALWQPLVDAGQAPWPLLSSFNAKALAAARETAPQLPRALLLDQLTPDCFDVAELLDCTAVILEHSLIDPALLQRLHHAGLRVLAYTVNDPDAAERLLGWGLDGLITDEVARFVPD
ncbi:glycerophosphoryl diester phosphodiesterase [Sphaerotilus hippei]|uniref:Glycerophosphoryl diester phosphodiesterase n=1 Tax=Sphaerotilus hippei TaxID=744406 RepID=A0A318GX77_9BURK|nr:glycerophosphodiester phosphodiesterase [Sphaerotilus hippei]PXW94117.1 glycerophosphoryl diester phosphodiesterase [Sphaerotilus hippei]